MNTLSLKQLEDIFGNNLDSPIFPVLADKYFSMYQYSRAKKVCEIGIKHDPENYLGKYILAKIYLINNELKKAEKILKEIITKDHNNINALLTLIELEISLKRSKKVIQQYISLAYKIIPQNKKINTLYKDFVNTGPKTKNIVVKKYKVYNPTIKINSNMATKTMYKLMINQKNIN